MSRMNLLLAVAVAAGVVGCAQCDTCDDFPVPCIGPNCGQLMPGGIPAALDATMGPPVTSAATPLALAARPADDSAGPGPVMPAPTPSPMTPPAATAEPVSPPTPMEPTPAPR